MEGEGGGNEEGEGGASLPESCELGQLGSSPSSLLPGVPGSEPEECE